MKIEIREEHRYNKEDMGTHLRFTIIGEMKEGSMEVPMWETRKTVTDNEQMLASFPLLDYTKREMAMETFGKFYEEIAPQLSKLMVVHED